VKGKSAAEPLGRLRDVFYKALSNEDLSIWSEYPSSPGFMKANPKHLGCSFACESMVWEA